MIEHQRKKNTRFMILGFILTVVAVFMTNGHTEWRTLDIVGNTLSVVGVLFVAISSTKLNKLMKAKTPD